MHRTSPNILIFALSTLFGCVTDDQQSTGDGETTGADDPCTPGDPNCECNNGLCLGEFECVNNLCISPDCMAGNEDCPCAQGNLCLGDLECNNGFCEPAGGDDCTPMAYFRCSGEGVYWFDSCNNQGELKENCDPNSQNCVNMSDEEAYCVPFEGCPDGVIGPGEDCEGTNLDGQSCQTLGYASGQLACAEWCTFDTSNCESCGNGVVDDPSEDCDGAELQSESCQSFNYDLGDLQCTPDCTFDLSDCGDCDCNGGPCCENSCDFSDANFECDPQADTEYGCPDGTEPGADVSGRSRAQYCSGDSSTCDGSYGNWGNWQVEDTCDWDEYCTPSDSTCNDCSFSFAVTQYECNNLSAASGVGPGGGEIIRVCSSSNPQTGYMTVTARKMDGSSFSDRPYQVRVSGPGTDPCGPNAWFFVVSDSDPVGIGTSELTFSFPAQWQPEQWEKNYCVTASTKFGDLGYDPNNAQQQSWWYSKKSTTVRECN